MPAVIKSKASVERRNERERRRIKNVNLAFDELREHVPTSNCSKRKISKVDTLQSAIEYIKVLESLVKGRRRKAAAIQTENASSTSDNEIDHDQSMERILNNAMQEFGNIVTQEVFSPQSDVEFIEENDTNDSADSSHQDIGYFSTPQSSPNSVFSPGPCTASSPEFIQSIQPPTQDVFDGVTVEDIEKILPQYTMDNMMMAEHYNQQQNMCSAKQQPFIIDCVKSYQPLMPVYTTMDN